MRPIRVLLVEDNEVYRESLKFLLGRLEDIAVVASVGEGSRAAGACADAEADVALVDFRLPDVNGADAAAAVRERCPGVAIVFLSASAGAEEVEAARASGSPLVRKDQGIDVLVQAVRGASGRR